MKRSFVPEIRDLLLRLSASATESSTRVIWNSYYECYTSESAAMKISITRKSVPATSYIVTCIVLGGFICCCGAQGIWQL